MKVPLAPAGLREKDIEAVTKVLRSGNLTMGTEVAAFEEEMATYLGTKHFVMVNSGSSANLAIIEALLRPTKMQASLRPGDGVLVPVIAWPTTVWPLVQLGLTPYFVDVEQNSIAIDLREAQKLVDKNKDKIRGLFPIHPLGFGMDSSELNEFAKANNLVLINDMCESLGSWQDGKHSGIEGLMSSFSFYFSHHMTTMEGGGVSTNYSEIYDDLRSIRSHGWSRDRTDVDDWSLEVHPSMKKFTFISTGYNIRPMEVQAAIGRLQLRDLDHFIDRRRHHVSRVAEAIEGTAFRIIGKPKSQAISAFKGHSWMHIAIEIDTTDYRKDRQNIVRFLEDAGVETRPPLTGNFLAQPAMKNLKSEVSGSPDFPVADRITNSTFLVGCHHDLSEAQITHLCKQLKLATKLTNF